MPIHGVVDNIPGEYFLYVASNRFLRVIHASLDGFPDDKVAAAVDMQARLQSALDRLINLKDLASDDPDKIIDPNLESLHWWDKPPPQPGTFLRHRPIVVDLCVWSDAKNNFLCVFRRLNPVVRL